ncbi:hypothetical protein [Streptomyces sp. WMMC897]|uniref:hypothetical protein n=1 Tax=Streptomyces sp. WMMC897 TaxID=3014782 RepID=UPI0022B6C0EB|nr:hypothetical protein [Streptomyces sp. WMMC897]MCZ7413053.1 hypothetical protein [Streptomyces sp. WMMC897]MCZ7413141.1 hypothetical protein [Streptomyces sp. WMMC897]MCZ7415475.1 hypothetical protein [Streptomyces sp. WMMC897]
MTHLAQPDEHLRRARQADRQRIVTYLRTYADTLPAHRHDQPLTRQHIRTAIAAAGRTLHTLPEQLATDYALRAARTLPLPWEGITIGEHLVLVLRAAAKAAR